MRPAGRVFETHGVASICDHDMAKKLQVKFRVKRMYQVDISHVKITFSNLNYTIKCNLNRNNEHVNFVFKGIIFLCVAHPLNFRQPFLGFSYTNRHRVFVRGQ